MTLTYSLRMNSQVANYGSKCFALSIKTSAMKGGFSVESNHLRPQLGAFDTYSWHFVLSEHGYTHHLLQFLGGT